ncbi:hypothetical protein HNQ36_005093 [Afipia massiliensis]|uniref:Uncharacterized protein n=1 Tax=Afipia massiliensis TaxID=211460 RepID=A0A840N8E6_9BRAD|nr:hypothetical protein [Afipia massiliensis]MBB5055082.1 hypothetical protein [Afipia massiliensis]
MDLAVFVPQFGQGTSSSRYFGAVMSIWEIQIYHPAENLLDQPSTLMAVATKMVAAATYP